MQIIELDLENDYGWILEFEKIYEREGVWGIAVEDALVTKYRELLKETLELSDHFRQMATVQGIRNKAFENAKLNYGDPIYKIADRRGRFQLFLSNDQAAAYRAADAIGFKSPQGKKYKIEQVASSLTALELIELFKGAEEVLRKKAILSSWIKCPETQQFLQEKNLDFTKLSLKDQEGLAEKMMNLQMKSIRKSKGIS